VSKGKLQKRTWGVVIREKGDRDDCFDSFNYRDCSEVGKESADKTIEKKEKKTILKATKRKGSPSDSTKETIRRVK